MLEEVVANRYTTTRSGFNCYINSALITRRSLCGLVGFEIDSRKVSDMADPPQPKIKFERFAAIRANLDLRIEINDVKDEKQLKEIANWEQIVVSLNAANRCVAHFDELADPEHRADPETVQIAAKVILRELRSRVRA